MGNSGGKTKGKKTYSLSNDFIVSSSWTGEQTEVHDLGYYEVWGKKTPDATSTEKLVVSGTISNVVNLNLGSTITELPERCFGESFLDEVTGSSTSLKLLNSSFTSSKLTSVNLSTTNLIFGTNRNFNNCSLLMSFVVNNNSIDVLDAQFYGCCRLASISFAPSNIGEYAFQNCYALKSINLTNLTGAVGICAFSNCYNLYSLTSRTFI